MDFTCVRNRGCTCILGLFFGGKMLLGVSSVARLNLSDLKLSFMALAGLKKTETQRLPVGSQ